MNMKKEDAGYLQAGIFFVSDIFCTLYLTYHKKS